MFLGTLLILGAIVALTIGAMSFNFSEPNHTSPYALSATIIGVALLFCVPILAMVRSHWMSQYQSQGSAQYAQIRPNEENTHSNV